MEDKVEVKQEDALRWPDGWERTRINDRVKQASWKKLYAGYRESAIKELTMLGATSILISRSNNERLDPGIAIWFSRKKQDYSWQEGLGLDTPAPTLDEIDKAFEARAMKHHPDRGGDIEIFRKLIEHRKNAKAWVLGTHEHAHDYVLACDRFTEARWNLAALKLAFQSFRSLERVGVPAILERTLDRAFGNLPAPVIPRGGN